MSRFINPFHGTWLNGLFLTFDHPVQRDAWNENEEYQQKACGADEAEHVPPQFVVVQFEKSGDPWHHRGIGKYQPGDRKDHNKRDSDEEYPEKEISPEDHFFSFHDGPPNFCLTKQFFSGCMS
jgi:hypothetical protein